MRIFVINSGVQCYGTPLFESKTEMLDEVGGGSVRDHTMLEPDKIN